LDSELIEIATGDRLLTDLTDRIKEFCAGRGDGLLNVFAPHATAGLALIELGSGSEEDLLELLSRWLPADDRYRHRHGSRGHGRDHLLPVFVTPSLVLPVVHGEPAIGIWQSVVIVDTNRDNRVRRLQMTFLSAASTK
jgi:secondary thiamine-phosphate synthase enzyme